MQNLKIYLAGVMSAVLVFCLIGTASASVGKVTQELEYRNIKVSLDGKILDLRNAAGEPVEPFMFGGTNYLPVRALAEALGMDVSWDSAHATVVLTTAGAKNSASESATVNISQYISEETAKKAALNHAGITQSEASYIRVELGRENGRAAYEVEFRSGDTEYDCDIDALTGEVLSFKRETTSKKSAASGETGTAVQSGYIGEERAKSIALSHAGLTESNVSRLRVEMDTDHGRKQYEVEFHVGRVEYSYDIDAVTGHILGYEIDDD